MKTIIVSNGEVINIKLTPENSLETAIVSALDLSKQVTIVTKDSDNELTINVDTKRR